MMHSPNTLYRITQEKLRELEREAQNVADLRKAYAEAASYQEKPKSFWLQVLSWASRKTQRQPAQPVVPPLELPALTHLKQRVQEKITTEVLLKTQDASSEPTPVAQAVR